MALPLCLYASQFDERQASLLTSIQKEASQCCKRIGAGIFLSIVSMIVSAIVEERRRSIALTDPIPGIRTRGDISSMSGFWLVPQLALAGLAEAFTAIGQVEFYYKQFPENMRSIAGSLFFCGMAGSSYLSGFLIAIVHRTTEGLQLEISLPEDLNKGDLITSTT
ncbi:hypothetical protein J5N97_000253 [Dioscorea zingiberensis]|uniref:Uncharacterized protein n=1 Tax=Dioscorea zingiberensis TaxID=325984 RepID=A0A9D5BSN0_9LILI|nr:hypothetical protein J5N97_000253 [Dioscorea zingiberensis]